MATLRQLAGHLGSLSLLAMAEKAGLHRPVSCRELMDKVIASAHEIKHVFVLMLENRSFDHMLGFAGIVGWGIDGKKTKADDLVGVDASNWLGVRYTAQKPAEFWLTTPDPGHEFTDTLLQLCGAGSTYPPGGPYPPINSSGFVLSYSARCETHPDAVMKCFAPDQLPVLTTLANEFALCDRWFSSIPGPTWPNRYFVHCASSGGLDDSPSGADEAWWSRVEGLTFPNGTVFTRLDGRGKEWMIFEDENPQTQSIDDMDDDRFHDMSHFRKHIEDPGLSASYIFIEPNYGHILPFGAEDNTCGTSQHPIDDVTSGEWLIKAVYDIVRNSPHWEHSVIVITWDEHGGFYDHVKPPSAVAPGDAFIDDDFNKHGFDFRQLGVRVPAVIISPLIPRHTIDHTVYDHSSVPATLERLFGLEPMTERDRHANSFEHLFSLDLARTDAPTSLPAPAVSPPRPYFSIPGFDCPESPAIELSKMDQPIEAHLRGFVYVAFIRHSKLAPPEEKPAVLAEYRSLRTNRDALEYMRKVRPRVRAQMNLPPIRTDVFVALGIRSADGHVPLVPPEEIKPT